MILAITLLLLNFGNYSFAQSDEKLVILETNLGTIVIEFFPEDAPNHVNNFIKLAESGFYDGTLFHRIIPGFMIQGGDPNTVSGDPSTWGIGGPENSVDFEYSAIKHKKGILSMARSTHVDSAGSQFFIVHKDSNSLDELYTAFGRIVTQESFDTLDKIASVQTTATTPVDPEQVKIMKVEVVDHSEVSNLLQLEEPERVFYIFEVTDYTKYQNEEFRFVISHPISWTVNENEQGNPNESVVSFDGQKTGLLAPIINIIIQETEQKSFRDKIIEYDNFLQESVDLGKLEILSQEMVEINGQEVYMTERIQEMRSQNSIFDAKIKEIIFPIDEKFYILTYYNDQKYFDKQLFAFTNLVNSLSITSEKNEGGGCLIATATYGSEMAPQVQQLRELRDNTILSTESGTAFMTGFNQFYYSFSPIVADLEREHPIFKEAVKIVITPMISSLSILNYVDMDSEIKVLGYGLSLIILNLGMYIAVPAIVINKLRK